jgi:hypothetical protein
VTAANRLLITTREALALPGVVGSGRRTAQAGC